MITETLTLPNLFTSIRCLADDHNKYLQEAVFAHYCMECGQVFLARFDEYSCGMSYMRRWKGEYYKCPNCGKESIDTYDETKFWNTVAYEKKPGKYVPKTLELTLQEFKEKIRLDIKGECIAIDPEHPAWAKKANVRESITFDIRKQKTWFKQFIGKESGEAIDITNPFSTALLQYSLLRFLGRNSRAWREHKPEIIHLVKKLRDTVCKKIKKIKGYTLKSIAIPGTPHNGLMVDPIRNMAWRLAVTDGPNLKDFYDNSTYNETNDNATIDPKTTKLTKENLEEIINECRNGKSYPQAVLKAYNIPDTKSGRKLVTNDTLYVLPILKTIAETDLDAHGKKIFKDTITEQWTNHKKQHNSFCTSEFYWSDRLLPNEEGIHFLNESIQKVGQSKALPFITAFPVDLLNDTGELYNILTEEEKAKVWKYSGSPKKVHDTCTKLNWYHKHPDYNLNVPEHIVNRLMMQKDQMKFFLPETYYQLRAAGKELHNCVGGEYPARMKKGNCCIVLVADDNGKLKICIELVKDEIVQAKLINNKPVRENPTLNKMMNTWAKEKKLVIATNDIEIIKEKRKLRKAV